MGVGGTRQRKDAMSFDLSHTAEIFTGFAHGLFGDKAQVVGLSCVTIMVGAYYVPTFLVTAAGTDTGRLSGLGLWALLGLPAALALAASAAAIADNNPEWLLLSAAPSSLVLLVGMAVPVVARASAEDVNSSSPAVVEAQKLADAQVATVQSMNGGLIIGIDWVKFQVVTIISGVASIATSLASGVQGIASLQSV